MSSGLAAATRWWDRGYQTRFPLRFLLYVLISIRLSAFLTSAWPIFTKTTAKMVIWLCNTLGLPATVGSPPKAFGISLASASSVTVVFGNGAFSYQIIGECTAVVLFGIFAAALLAYPASWRHRAIGLILGAPALVILNLVRLVLLAWLGVHYPQIFDQVHVIWWQVFNVLVVALGWFAWSRWVSSQVEPEGPSHGGLRREVLSSLTVFAAVVAGFSLVGVLANGASVYGKVLRGIMWIISGVSGRGEFFDHATGPNAIWSYSILAATSALFLATLNLSVRRRLKGMLVVGVPVVVFYHTIGFLIEMRMGMVWRMTPGNIDRFLQIAIPVSAWYAWHRRTRNQLLVTD